jgi:hypothetical protein
MRGLPADGIFRKFRSHGAGVACLRRFETVERSGIEARASGAVHWLALEWSGVEPASIGEVRPQNQPLCRCHLEAQARNALWTENRSREDAQRLCGGRLFSGSALSRLGGGAASQPGEKRSRKPVVLDALFLGRGVAPPILRLAH